MDFYTINYIQNHQNTDRTALYILMIVAASAMISYCSSIPGGTFMPILVLGALMGTIFATVFIHLGLIPTDNYTNIIIVSMAAYLGAILRAPFTAIILLTEMIGTVEQVLPMIMSVFIAYLILALLGGEPIYTVLRKQMGFK